jgi:hypothetical protein
MPPLFLRVRPAGRSHLAVQVRRTTGKGKCWLKSKGVSREAESGGRKNQNATPKNKNHIRGITTEMRRPISLKTNSCPESRAVDAAVMSAEVRGLLHAELPAPGKTGSGDMKHGKSGVPTSLRGEK